MPEENSETLPVHLNTAHDMQCDGTESTDSPGKCAAPTNQNITQSDTFFQTSPSFTLKRHHKANRAKPMARLVGATAPTHQPFNHGNLQNDFDGIS